MFPNCTLKSSYFLSHSCPSYLYDLNVAYIECFWFFFLGAFVCILLFKVLFLLHQSWFCTVYRHIFLPTKVLKSDLPHLSPFISFSSQKALLTMFPNDCHSIPGPTWIYIRLCSFFGCSCDLLMSHWQRWDPSSLISHCLRQSLLPIKHMYISHAPYKNCADGCVEARGSCLMFFLDFP